MSKENIATALMIAGVILLGTLTGVGGCADDTQIVNFGVMTNDAGYLVEGTNGPAESNTYVLAKGEYVSITTGEDIIASVGVWRIERDYDDMYFDGDWAEGLRIHVSGKDYINSYVVTNGVIEVLK